MNPISWPSPFTIRNQGIPQGKVRQYLVWLGRALGFPLLGDLFVDELCEQISDPVVGAEDKPARLLGAAGGAARPQDLLHLLHLMVAVIKELCHEMNIF